MGMIAGRVDRRGGGGHGTRVFQAFMKRMDQFEALFMGVWPAAGFQTFWEAYPRKQAKADAKKAWAKLQPDAALLETMLEAIEQQKRGRQWRDGFIPLPASWLRGERWTDELGPQDFYQARL